MQEKEAEIQNTEVSIKIPENGSVVTAEQVKKDADSKFKDINYILLSVVIILLVMVATLLIGAFHFNSATYKEYSQKTESVETTQKINQDLLDQNKKNQELILEQQKEIQKLLSK